MPRLIQPSFAKGEISPALFGRVDTAAYQVALRTALNLIIHPYGGASSRDGMRYLEPIKDHTKAVRLIPFEFKTSDQYVLEFGDQYMRVMRNDAHVLDTSEQEAITGITNANPAVVTTAAHGYVTGEEVFIQGVVGMTEVNNKRFKIGTTTATTFELLNQWDSANVDSTAFGTYTSGGTADLVFEIVTPYLEAELFDLTFVQSADVMTICHKNHAPRELERLDNDIWNLTEAAFAPLIDHPSGIQVTVNTTGTETRRYGVTSIDADTGEESLLGHDNIVGGSITGATQADPVVITATAHLFADGDEIEIQGVGGMTELNGRRFIVANQAVNSFELEGEDGTGHTAYTSGGTARGTFVEVTNSNATEDNTISWTAVPGAGRYSIYRRDNGIWGIVGESLTTSFLDANVDPDTLESPPMGRNPFDLGNNPGAVTFFEQRRVFGGSTQDPDTSWFSQTGRISNFNVSSPVRADDAITARLTSRQVNEIRQYVPGQDLLTFTSGSEWTLTAGAEATLAPDTIQQRPQTTWGSSFRPPIEVGQTVLFVTDTENEVRSHSFNLQLDGFTGSDMLLFAEHLLENDTIVDWAFVRAPEPRIYIVLASGKALSFTFDQEQEVIAWTRWETKGLYKSLTVLAGNGPNNEDSVYFVVQRSVNGQNRRYIEVFRQRFFEVVEDCFFVDSGLTLDNPVAIEGATAASPVVITSTGHSLANGDFVDIHDIEWVPDVNAVFTETQPAQLNGGRFKVANVGANDFELNDIDDNPIDGTGFNAYVQGGVYRLAVDTLVGLDHMEGETLVALTDGNVTSDLTVASGSVTLPRAASRVQIGLRYNSDLQTLNVETPQGTTQAQKKKIANVTVRFRRSRGLLIGPDVDHLLEMPQRQFEAYGEATNLVDGDKQVDMSPDWNTHGRMYLRQKDPLPMTILAVIPFLEAGDEE
jgi:hypothetical protein